MRELASACSASTKWMVVGVWLLVGCKADSSAVNYKTLIPVIDGAGGTTYYDGETYVPWGNSFKDAEVSDSGALDAAGDAEIYDSTLDWVQEPDLTNLPEIPGFSGGSCLQMQSGINGLNSGGFLRQFQLYLPDVPEGKPVLFLWHDQGQIAEVFAQSMGGPALAAQWDLVVVAADGRTDFTPWGHGNASFGEQDLLFFYDLLSCLHTNFSVDRTRLYSLGQGAGASWSASLVARASEFLAASALFNVDVEDYAPAARAIPMVLTWGGPGIVFDFYGMPHNYEEIGTTLGTSLVEGGHSVLACAHTGGLTLPGNLLNALLPLLLDHSWTDPPGAFSPTAALPSGCTLN